MISENLEISIRACLKAGKSMCEIYNSDSFEKEIKKDNSPLTKADKTSHNIIVDTLLKTNIPILSEEGDQTKYSSRKYWNLFWLIDPLDGTKEFINKNGEFTINVALIEKQTPILGVVFAPVNKELYFAEKKLGSFKIESIKEFKDLKNLNHINLFKNSPPDIYTILVSRSHLNDQTLDFINKKKKMHKKVEIIRFGSSLKICKVAEGKAHCYPRLGPTMEWDTAAAHAVIKYSGKKILNYSTKNEIFYNKESLLNPFFVVS